MNDGMIAMALRLPFAINIGVSFITGNPDISLCYFHVFYSGVTISLCGIKGKVQAIWFYVFACILQYIANVEVKCSTFKRNMSDFLARILIPDNIKMF